MPTHLYIVFHENDGSFSAAVSKLL